MITPIQIDSDDTSANFHTFCCYGDTRSGKTRFAGTFPNAVFISDASERGWTTLKTMPPEAFYHEGKRPVVLPVSDQAAMIQALHIAEQWVRAGWVDTVVVDSLTFYAESWYQHELAKMIAVGGAKGVDTRALFGALANHLSNTRVQIHKWPCNVVWLALAAPPDDNQLGGPMLSGKSRQRFPAGCDHIFYHRRYEGLSFNEETQQDEMIPVYEVRTAQFGRYIAGGRDSGLLPEEIPWPTYRTFAGYLGIPEWAPKVVPQAAIDAVLQQAQAPAAAAAAAAATATAKAPAKTTVTRRAPPAASARK